MLDLNLGFGLAFFLFFTSTCFISLSSSQSRCSRGCGLALASYYLQPGNELGVISQHFDTSITEIVNYNPNISNQDSIQAGQRINVPFSCDCIQREFFGHVFSYELQSGDTYTTIARDRYANLTTVDWIQRFNTIDANRLPDTGSINVGVNCSCGDSSVSKDYGLFVTYPLRPGESLETVSSAANLSSDVIRSYNRDANFDLGSGLVYIPGRG